MEKMLKDLDTGLKGINERIPDINRGGCGLFAIYLWDELVQLGMTTRAVVFTDKLPVFSIYHVALKYGDIYIDSDGIHEEMLETSYAIETVMPLDVLQVEAFDASLWSDRFNRDYIPDLKKEIHNLGTQLLTQKRKSELDLVVSF